MNYPKYMSSKPSWINLHSTQRDELLPLLPTPGTWLVMPGSQLPSVFPDTFRAKIDSALIISVPTSTGGTYLVFSNHRVDRPASAIDIEPFGLIVHATSGPSVSGVYIHHGTWPERTRPAPPPSFWSAVSGSGVGNFYLSVPPGGRHAGTLDELPRGDRGAFDAVVREIRARVDGTK